MSRVLIIDFTDSQTHLFEANNKATASVPNYWENEEDFNCFGEALGVFVCQTYSGVQLYVLSSLSTRWH